jgi:predicted TIM-barrel fold metal-dependent hydrolase
MKNENARRSFIKHLFSLLAFGVSATYSFEKKPGAFFGGMGFGAGKADAKTGSGKRTRKIGVEEHFGAGSEAQIKDRLKDMDEAGIDMQVLSENLAPDDKRSAEEAKAWAIEQNNTFARVIDKYPERFSAFAAVALHEPDEAARELERAVTQLGFKGTLIGGKRTFLDDPEYGVFLATAEKLDVPIYVHPSSFKLEPYLKYPILSRSMWGFSAEAGLHAMRMIIGGVFEKYPRLQIIIGHMGENIPFQLWRIDNRWLEEKDGGKWGTLGVDPSSLLLKKKPSEYFKNNFYITTSGMFWEPALKHALTAVGSDRILFAVDYNAESCQAAAKFIESASISKADKEKICHGNAERLLKL